jgi:hypothetical protein
LATKHEQAAQHGRPLTSIGSAALLDQHLSAGLISKPASISRWMTISSA